MIWFQILVFLAFVALLAFAVEQWARWVEPGAKANREWYRRWDRLP